MTVVLRGQLSKNGAGRRAVAVEETVVEVGGSGASFNEWPRSRVVGTADLDADGQFRIEYVSREASPPDARDWQTWVRVELHNASGLIATSPARHPAPVVEFDPVDGRGPASVIETCTVQGRITVCGRETAELTVVVFERTTIGTDRPGEPCIPSSSTRQVGLANTTPAGEYSLSFSPAQLQGDCIFPSQVWIEIHDGPTRLWESSLRLLGPIVTIDHELRPNCPDGATLVRVLDEDGARVDGAEIYVDGDLAGRTDGMGLLAVFPPLTPGALLAARKLMFERPTDRERHAEPGEANWAYRVYLTSVGIRHDPNGNDVKLPLTTVTDPSRVELRVRRRNTLVTVSLSASIEWNTTDQERDRIRDRLVEVSELLYNATDGQFAVERMFFAESGIGWDDADIRIYADLGQRSQATVAGIFGSTGVVRMNPNDSLYAGDSLHELGHYVLGVRDEYEGDDGPAVCTVPSLQSGTPFASGGGKDSCFLRGAHDMNKKKLCSAHPANPHALNTEQGERDCWSSVVSRFEDDGGRWRLMSPMIRGAIVDRLPDSGVPISRTTQPPPASDATVPSFIPVAGWKPRIRTIIDNRTIVEGLVVRAEFGGVPMRGQGVSVRSRSTGRSLRQGTTKAQYNLAYGLQTGDGEIPIRGAKVGDTAFVLGQAPGGGILVGSATITREDPHTLVVALSRFGFPFFLDVTAHGPGALNVAVRSDSAPPPDILVGPIDAAGGHVRLPSTLAGRIGGLPRDGAAAVAVAVPDGGGVVEHDVALHTVDDGPATCCSCDGVLKLRLPVDTFGEQRQLVIAFHRVGLLSGTPPIDVIAGPYQITTAPTPGNEWNRSATLVFRLPTSDLPEDDPDGWVAGLAIAEFDPLTGDWRHRVSACGAETPFVSTRIDRGGFYALVQRRVVED